MMLLSDCRFTTGTTGLSCGYCFVRSCLPLNAFVAWPAGCYCFASLIGDMNCCWRISSGNLVLGALGLENTPIWLAKLRGFCLIFGVILK